ncbi:hypothetical protein [Falsirhodobacter halotolerans]|uniref:hypothetical protein n=1 Tax=Falsirhodobacter halotolerans TaxID=1146892 RepID=UPI001FD184B6|nr:hypothetical protein [Falsirhodobacter halotolerans]MCJ8139488.1 hypothetical protein [Falsirhodobacter halotolerans]
MLDNHDVVVPDPDTYRALLRDTTGALQGQTASQATQDMVLEQIVDDGDLPERMVLAWDSFLSFPQWALRERLYPAAAERVRGLIHIFAAHEVEFFLSIRNPALFLPDLLAKQHGKDYATFVGNTDLLGLRWSDMIGDMVARNSNLRLTVWCDEDAPCLTPDILAAMTGIEDGTALTGWDDLLARLMDEDGLHRLRSALAEGPADRRAVIADHVARFIRPDMVEAEFDMPAWDQGMVDRMGELYEQDLGRIAAMPGVTFLTP